MRKSRYALEEKEYDLLNLLFPGYFWIHLESRNSKTSPEESIKYGGEYVIYGSQEQIEKLVKKLEPMIGGVIEAIKYSTVPVKLTPHAPENHYALVVYCDRRDRDEVIEILDEIGARNYEWKNRKDVWRDALKNPWFCFVFYNMDPEGFKKICRLVQMESSIDMIESFMKFASKVAGVFRDVRRKINEYPDEESLKREVRKLIEEKLYSID